MKHDAIARTSNDGFGTAVLRETLKFPLCAVSSKLIY
jgi:hypothetical protein